MYGDHVHRAVLKAHAIESGITIHFVNELFDEGEIIYQSRFKIEKNDTSVVAVTADNKILGSIAGISLKDILYCLENGYLIFGIIEEINDGSCILVIRCNGKA
jgi:formyltetrahydrofolate hydrolase